MKSTQLLSVVLSLIMVFGVSAGSAFAEISDDDFDENSMDNENFDDDRHDDLDDKLEDFCEMDRNEKENFFNEHPRIAQFEDRLTIYCNLSEEERDDAIEEFVEEHFPEAKNHDKYDLDDMLERYCDMTDVEKKNFLSTNEIVEEHVGKMNEYCELNEEEREAFIEEHEDEYEMHHEKDMREKLEKYCELSDEDKKLFLEEHDKSNDHSEKMNMYCTLDEESKLKFIDEHKEEHKNHMKEKVKDKHHMDYERLCSLSESERILEIDDSEKLERLSVWCDMTPQEREDYKKEHHDKYNEEKMHEKAKDKIHEKKMKMSEMSPRLKDMIMDKRSISDEKLAEIKMKYQEMHGDLTEAKKSELHMKFQEHMSSNSEKMSDEYKSAIHDRVAEMKAFKAELREKSSTMTDEEKQQLREEFIEKAKEMHLAWIAPRAQINAGIDATDIECREGFNLVMKESNGVPICLKADTALKMIERGFAVPAN
ncbi:MAG: ABC transporter substrate-binding protein [Nitrosopumilus sp.]